ncbi:MAG: class I SAM-dependent methyltransferase [Mycobacterium sp.]
MSHISAFKGGYSRPLSWFYDTFIAEAATQMSAHLVDVIGAESVTGPILDVGCGGGQFLAALARSRPEASLHGADYSAAQVHRAEARLSQFGGRVHIRHAPAEKLPFEDNTFAAVVSIGSIKHWQSQTDGLAEMVRVLRPGGLLVVGELDRGCTVADAKRFLALRTGFRFFGPVPLMVFRTYISGLSIDLEDARALVAALPLTDTEVQRLAGQPALQFRGRKAA